MTTGQAVSFRSFASRRKSRLGQAGHTWVCSGSKRTLPFYCRYLLFESSHVRFVVNGHQAVGIGHTTVAKRKTQLELLTAPPKPIRTIPEEMTRARGKPRPRSFKAPIREATSVVEEADENAHNTCLLPQGNWVVRPKERRYPHLLQLALLRLADHSPSHKSFSIPVP